MNFVPLTPPGSSGRHVFVAPDGQSTNGGSKERPLDLATAFAGSERIKPGDTVWLRGGVYKGAVTSQLTGAPDAPIIVRQYPGERAILDASSRTASALTVRGSDTWYWGFEVADSHPARMTTEPSYTSGLRTTSITVFGPRTRFINMIVHDGEQGFGFWSHAIDAEVYGTLIYNVGFEAGDRGHGHSVYVQNETGTKRLVDNILFNSHGFGIHAYTERGFVDNIHLEGNIAFNHGLLSRAGPTAAFLFRSKNAAPHNPTLINNYAYYPGDQPGRGLDVTTPLPLTKGCTNAVLTGNYFAAPGAAVAITCQSIASVGDNTFFGPIFGITPFAYPNNVFHHWKPKRTEVFVRRNVYEPGRAHVAVYNWEHSPSVSVDLGNAGLKPGDAYEIRDAQNYFAGPIATGTYWPWHRAVVPMTGLKPADPAGTVAVQPRHTAPEFGAFVVRKPDEIEQSRR
jgi:hypothetical protein